MVKSAHKYSTATIGTAFSTKLVIDAVISLFTEVLLISELFPVENINCIDK